MGDSKNSYLLISLMHIIYEFGNLIYEFKGINWEFAYCPLHLLDGRSKVSIEIKYFLLVHTLNSVSEESLFRASKESWRALKIVKTRVIFLKLKIITMWWIRFHRFQNSIYFFKFCAVFKIVPRTLERFCGHPVPIVIIL